jgi:hypothetical protein
MGTKQESSPLYFAWLGGLELCHASIDGEVNARDI